MNVASNNNNNNNKFIQYDHFSHGITNKDTQLNIKIIGKKVKLQVLQ